MSGKLVYIFLMLSLVFMYAEVRAALPPVSSNVKIKDMQSLGLLRAFRSPEVKNSLSQAMASGQYNLKVSKNRLPSAASR